MNPGRPYIVSIKVRQLGRRCRSSDAALMPSWPGISMSTTATSGRVASAVCNHLVAPTDLCDDLDVLFELQQASNRRAEHELVFGQQHPDHLRQRSVRWTRRRSAEQHPYAEAFAPHQGATSRVPPSA